MNVNGALKSQFDKSGNVRAFADGVLAGMDTSARGPVVNRTHRVVRERAKMMQARRSYVRSLMLPLIICSALLILTVFAVWSGLYQYQATDAVEAVQDLATQAANEASDHIMVLLLWFVPVSLTMLAVIWFTRSRRADGRATR
jgi:hypothetical protein